MTIQEIISDCLCDINDINNALATEEKCRLKDNDGTETTIQDCIDNICDQLLELKKREEVAYEECTIRESCGCTEANVLDGNHNVCGKKS